MTDTTIANAAIDDARDAEECERATEEFDWAYADLEESAQLLFLARKSLDIAVRRHRDATARADAASTAFLAANQ